MFAGIPEISFTAWPEMLAWPYLILKGWLPYRDIAIAHNPLLIIILAGFYKLFGVGILQLKMFTWGLIAANSSLTYFISKKFWTKKIAVFSSVLYLILCIVYQGNGLWFDLALTPFALLLYLFLREKKYLYAGIIFALGFLTKQTFIYFAIPIGLAVIQERARISSVWRLATGLLTIFVAFVLLLYSFGILDDFYFWAIKFGVLYLPSAVGQTSFPTVKQFLFAVFPLIIFVFDPALLPFTFAGLMGVYPRWELFHFQPALPFLAITISTFVFSSQKRLFYKSKITKPSVMFFLVMFLCVGIYRSLGNNTRFYESDVTKITEEIKEIKTDDIYIINYWDNVYALTNTVPATKPLIPYIPWYLSYSVTEQSIMNDLKNKMPEVIVVGVVNNSWSEIGEFVTKYYSCNLVEKKVELCRRNKN